MNLQDLVDRGYVSLEPIHYPDYIRSKTFPDFYEDRVVIKKSGVSIQRKFYVEQAQPDEVEDLTVYVPVEWSLPAFEQSLLLSLNKALVGDFCHHLTSDALLRMAYPSSSPHKVLPYVWDVVWLKGDVVTFSVTSEGVHYWKAYLSALYQLLPDKPWRPE